VKYTRVTVALDNDAVDPLGPSATRDLD